MEAKNQQMLHNLCLKERHTMEITGVLDIQSFDAQEVILSTSQGGLVLKGKELLVSRLNLEKGEADIQGHFNSILYADTKTHKRQKGESLLARLFQ